MASVPVAHIAVVFSGPPRKDGIPHAVAMADPTALCSCFDILLSESHNFLDDANWDSFVQKLRAHTFTAVHFAPPCSTWSCARRGNGPPPLRAADGPELYGRKSLTAAQKLACREGTLLALRASHGMMVCIELRIPFTFETPYYMGKGPHVTKLPEYQKVLAMTGVATMRIDQCRFGARTTKPSLFIMYNIKEMIQDSKGGQEMKPVVADDITCNHEVRSWTVPWSGQTRLLPHPWSHPFVCHLNSDCLGSVSVHPLAPVVIH